MKFYGVTLEECEMIAKDLGFRLENPREGGVKVPWVAFTIRMAVPLPSRADMVWFECAGTLTLNGAQDARYRSIAMALQYRARAASSLIQGKPRWANGAVCWHGHKAFLDRLVDAHPGLRFESQLWRFEGAKEYRAKVYGTGMANVGSQAYPIQAREACDCYGG